MPLQTITTLAPFSVVQGETWEQRRFKFVQQDGTTPWSVYGATIVVTLRKKHAATAAMPTVAQWTSANGKVATDTTGCTATIVVSSADQATIAPGEHELAVGVVAYTGAAHVVATCAVTVVAAGAEFGGAATPAVDAQADLTIVVNLPSIPIPDAPTNAASGFELNSLVFGDMNSHYWIADPAIGPTSPPLDYTASDGAITAPTGVKGGESYTINVSRTASAGSRVGRRFRTPLGCDAVTFEFHGKKYTGDAGTETVVLAIYQSDATTLVASQAVSLGANSGACTLTAPVAGGTEYLACVWFNNAALGTHGSDGSTQARGAFSRARVVPSGAAMTGVFAGDFWRVDACPWPYTAATAAALPHPPGWGVDPHPTLVYPHEAIADGNVPFSPLVVRCLGKSAAVEYVWDGGTVASWASPLLRTAAVGATLNSQASAPTSLPVIQQARYVYPVALSGDGPRLLAVAPMQASNVTAAYVGAYLGTQVEPPPTGVRTAVVMGDSISVGYQIASSDGAFEILRRSFDGQLINYGAGGLSLAALGYVGAGGVLDPALANVRATTNATIADMLPAPTELWVQLGTNDWGATQVSAANYQIGLAGVVDWFRGVFPTGTVRLIKPINRSGEAVPNAAGSVLEDFRTAMVNVAATRSAWVTVYTPPTIDLGDGTHPSQAGYAAYGAWLISVMTP